MSKAHRRNVVNILLVRFNPSLGKQTRYLQLITGEDLQGFIGAISRSALPARKIDDEGRAVAGRVRAVVRCGADYPSLSLSFARHFMTSVRFFALFIHAGNLLAKL